MEPMQVRRGRALAIGTGVAGTAAFFFLCLSPRGPVREPWHLWQLDSADLAVRSHAAERLGEMRSVRAIPRLMALLEADYAGDPPMPSSARALARIGAPAVPALLAIHRKGETEAVRRVTWKILEEMG